MYVVRDKETKRIIHINPAPLSQELKEHEVYFMFDTEKMEIGRKDGLLPEYFDINEKGEIIPLTISDMVRKGEVRLEPYQKIVDDRIVEKSISELVEEGILQLSPNKIDEALLVCKQLQQEVNKLKEEYQSLKREIAAVKLE